MLSGERRKRVTIYVTREERDIIRRKAAKKKMTVSEYFRRCAEVD